MAPEPAAGKAIMAGSILGFSLPTFWVGLMLIMVFAVDARLAAVDRPRRDRSSFLGVDLSFLTLDGLAHMLLPAFNLALFKISLVIRLTRAGMRETMLHGLRQVRARQGPVARAASCCVHVLKNIMIPIVTVIGLEFGC